jgi:hypothetical protein
MMIHSRPRRLFGSAASTAAMESIRVCLGPTLCGYAHLLLVLGNAVEASINRLVEPLTTVLDSADRGPR